MSGVNRYDMDSSLLHGHWDKSSVNLEKTKQRGESGNVRSDGWSKKFKLNLGEGHHQKVNSVSMKKFLERAYKNDEKLRPELAGHVLSTQEGQQAALDKLREHRIKNYERLFADSQKAHVMNIADRPDNKGMTELFKQGELSISIGPVGEIYIDNAPENISDSQIKSYLNEALHKASYLGKKTIASIILPENAPESLTKEIRNWQQPELTGGIKLVKNKLVFDASIENLTQDEFNQKMNEAVKALRERDINVPRECLEETVQSIKDKYEVWKKDQSKVVSKGVEKCERDEMTNMLRKHLTVKPQIHLDKRDLINPGYKVSLEKFGEAPGVEAGHLQWTELTKGIKLVRTTDSNCYLHIDTKETGLAFFSRMDEAIKKLAGSKIELKIQSVIGTGGAIRSYLNWKEQTPPAHIRDPIPAFNQQMNISDDDKVSKMTSLLKDKSEISFVAPQKVEVPHGSQPTILASSPNGDWSIELRRTRDHEVFFINIPDSDRGPLEQQLHIEIRNAINELAIKHNIAPTAFSTNDEKALLHFTIWQTLKPTPALLAVAFGNEDLEESRQDKMISMLKKTEHTHDGSLEALLYRVNFEEVSPPIKIREANSEMQVWTNVYSDENFTATLVRDGDDTVLRLFRKPRVRPDDTTFDSAMNRVAGELVKLNIAPTRIVTETGVEDMFQKWKVREG